MTNNVIKKVLNNPQRLAALHRLNLLDTDAEEAFDRLAQLATRAVHAPVALVSLVDSERQFFKSCLGLPEPWLSWRETPLSHSFCQHVVATAEPLVVSDARTDPRLRDNHAIRDLGAVAYLGSPLILPGGEVIGSFCVIDTKPRDWNEAEIATIRDLATSVMSEIELRHTRDNLLELVQEQVRAMNASLRESEARFRATFDQAAVGVAHVTPNGCFQRINQKYCDIMDYSQAELLTKTFQDITHPDDLDADLAQVAKVLAGENPTFSMEKRYFRKDGSIVWANLTVSLVRKSDGNPDYFIAVVEDISARKQAEAETTRLGRLLDASANEIYLADLKTLHINIRQCCCTTCARLQPRGITHDDAAGFSAGHHAGGAARTPCAAVRGQSLDGGA